MIARIFNFVKTHQSDVVLAITIALITVISYELGRASVTTENAISGVNNQAGNLENIVRPNAGQGSTATINTTPKDETVVASKKSKSKLYHFTYCPGAKNISAANKVTFPDEAAAIAAGYTLAGNCQK